MTQEYRYKVYHLFGLEFDMCVKKQ